VALPRAFASPDWDFLAMALLAAAGLCAAGFASGLAVAWCLSADPGSRVSLMFGLGMANNGTGLVLAGAAFAHIPDALLPVLFFNLVQHLAAAMVPRAGEVNPNLPSQAALPA
jgi:BASS family bile acid:Na+ symporter